MANSRCTNCGAEGLEPGFLEDAGEHSKGFLKWIEGPLERGILGGARRMGKGRWAVSASRCGYCGHLELFAHEPV